MGFNRAAAGIYAPNWRGYDDGFDYQTTSKNASAKHGRSADATQPEPYKPTPPQESPDMAKRHEPILELVGKICRFGKISNNTEFDGDDWEGAFTIPIRGLMLDKNELNRLRADKHCFASWFDSSGDVVRPMPWWGEEEFSITGSFEAEELVVTVSGDRELKFEAEEGDPDSDDDVGRPACVLSRLSLHPLAGGLTELRFHLTLHPGLGKTNLTLQEHQHREVKLTLVEGRAKAKSDKQESLPLGAPKDAGESAASTH